jgi:hypothetical protein
MAPQDRRFWLGLVGFVALLALILALGLVCGANHSPDDPSPNAGHVAVST